MFFATLKVLYGEVIETDSPKYKVVLSLVRKYVDEKVKRENPVAEESLFKDEDSPNSSCKERITGKASRKRRLDSTELETGDKVETKRKSRRPTDDIYIQVEVLEKYKIWDESEEGKDGETVDNQTPQKIMSAEHKRILDQAGGIDILDSRPYRLLATKRDDSFVWKLKRYRLG
jgi:hypothetical protein